MDRRESIVHYGGIVIKVLLILCAHSLPQGVELKERMTRQTPNITYQNDQKEPTESILIAKLIVVTLGHICN